MPPRKRKAAAIAHDDQDAAVSTPDSSSRRRSARVSSSAKKSHYFEGDSDSELAGAPSVKSKSNAKARARAKAKPTAAKGQRGRPKKATNLETNPNQDEDDQDVYNKDSTDAEDAQKDDQDEESDDDDDDSAPPKLEFIPIPKLRDLAGVSYSPSTIHPNTLHFLADLRRNNKRSWLKLHDAEYRRSLSDWESYAMSLTDSIVSVDETIPELPFRDINFRIYRDIRFSKDPTPYKPHYSASWSRTGRKGPYACYYVHLEPGKCFVGGGLWHPDGPALGKLRSSIDERRERWRRVLMGRDFEEMFLNLGGKGVKGKMGQKGKGKQGRAKKGAEGENEEEEDDGLDEERAVIKAFCAANAENALKTKPKGFDAEHRDIELLKLRNFTVGKKLPDSVFTSEGGQEQVLDVIKAMVPFVTHLNRIVMPDPGDDDDSEEEEA